MAVTFCGHGDISYNYEIRQKLHDEIEQAIKKGEKEFLLGGYGSFDLLSAHIVKRLKEKYPDIQSLLVIPYLVRKYDTDLYDGTVYPPIENVPKRLAIIKRNEWMIDASNAVIAYVEHGWGGAAKTLNYAIKKKRRVINIAIKR